MIKNKHEIDLKIEDKEWEEALTKAFEKVVKEVKADGFRKGKMPRDIYEKKYGKQSLYMDAVDYILPNAYTKAIENSKLMPIVQPEVDIKDIDDNHVTFTFKIVTKPEVKLGKYKKLGIKKPAVSVTKDEIEKEINNIKNKYAELVTKEDKIKNGDIAIIDFEGFKDKKAFDGGKGTNYSLEIGSKSFIPGFEEQLIGKKTNDEFEFNINFPEDYASEELKGKEVTFKIKINEVKERIIPELTDELYLDLGLEGVKNKEDLEKVLEENIKARKENEVENKYIDDLLKAAAKNIEVSIPEELINEETKRMLEQYKEQLKMQGISIEQFFEITKTTEANLKEKMLDEAKSRVLYRLMLEEIALKEEIEIDDKLAEEQASIMAEKYDMKKDEFLEAFGGLDMIKYDMKMKKVIEILKGNE